LNFKKTDIINSKTGSYDFPFELISTNVMLGKQPH